MEFKEIENTLRKYAKYVIQQARTNLTKGKHNASKELYNSLKYELDKEKDAFVHASAVKAAGMRYLNEGDKLEFTLEDGPKGPSAVNLKKID